VASTAGPQFKFTEAISFSVNCEDQDESIISGETFPPTWIDRAVRLAQRQISVSRGRSTRSFSTICWAIPMPEGESRHESNDAMDKIDIADLEKAARG